MEEIEPRPMDHADVEEAAPEHQNQALHSSVKDFPTAASQPMDSAVSVEPVLAEDVSETDSLPPISRLPHPPAAFDANRYSGKDKLKIAEKEHASQTKA